MNHQEIHKKVHEALQKRKDPTELWGDDWLSLYIGLVVQDHHPVDKNTVNDIADLIVRRKVDENYLKQGRNLLAGFLAVPFLEKLGRETEAKAIAALTDETLSRAGSLEQTKFSILNSPEFLYGTALSLSKSAKFKSDTTTVLNDVLAGKLGSLSPASVSRSCLILAAAILMQLDWNDSLRNFISSIDTTKLRIDENISLLWFLAKFGESISRKLAKDMRKDYFITYSSVESTLDAQVPSVSFDLLELSDDRTVVTQAYCLSPIELILLDELVLARILTKGVNVQYLFEQLPLHVLIKGTASKLFQEGNYSQAIEESFKLLINEVKKKANYPKDNKGDEFDGVPLMRHVFGISRPVLVFNKLKTRADKDEQEGMTNLFVGATQGIRNPATHVSGPQTNPLDALELLELASLLMNKLDRARKARSGDALLGAHYGDGI